MNFSRYPRVFTALSSREFRRLNLRVVHANVRLALLPPAHSCFDCCALFSGGSACADIMHRHTIGRHAGGSGRNRTVSGTVDRARRTGFATVLPFGDYVERQLRGAAQTAAT